MLFKILVDSFFWAFIVQIFLAVVDSFSKVNFGLSTYSVFGFIILYFYTIVVVALLRYTAKK